MKTKLSTFFLISLLFFTMVIAAGCEKEPEKEKEKETEIVDDGSKTDVSKEDKKEDKPTKTVKLLKRNGVEWKENTRINSYRGAKKYTVVWGDTLSLIARTWHVNCYKLAKYNGIKNIDLIEVDQVIYNYAAK